MISDSFNPYTYHETGSVKVSTRYDGEYSVDENGNYYYFTPNLNSETRQNINFGSFGAAVMD